MEIRVNIFEKEARNESTVWNGGYLKKSPIERSLLELIAFRTSKINGCAFCLDMHTQRRPRWW